MTNQDSPAIIQCSDCGQKNRIRQTDASKRPICGKCGGALLNASAPIIPKHMSDALNEMQNDAVNSIMRQPEWLRMQFEKMWGLLQKDLVENRDALPGYKELFVPHRIAEEDLRSIYRLVCATTCLSAWYHCTGNRTDRDNLISNASVILSGCGLGIAPTDAFSFFFNFEKLYRGLFRKSGIIPSTRLWSGVLRKVFWILVVVGLLVVAASK